jgi:phenylacetate-CoA ligase
MAEIHLVAPAEEASRQDPTDKNRGARMLDSINRHLMQPLAAWKNGSRHLGYLRELKKTQFDSPETIRHRQLTMLKVILNHAWNTVPYYRKAWTDSGIHPRDVRSLEDSQHFPIVTKADLRGREEQFLSSQCERENLMVKRTSGSTGVPLTIYLDEAGKQWKYATTLRSDEWSGWRLGQRVAKVWGNPEYRQFGWRGRLRNTLLDRAVYLDTCHLTDERVEDFFNILRRRQPGLIFGHAHSLYLLAGRMKPGELRPNGIISTAMPLHDWQRRKIEQVFDTKVTDRYGCEEVSLIACECERHHGLHINSDSIYVEIERRDESHTGNLIVTDLTNRAMPLIRYRNGDVVTLSDRVCECGRGLPLIEKIEGRDADYVVTPSGALISGISLTENFALKIAGTAQMQIVQETVTHLRIRIVPAAEFGEDSRRQIAGLVRDTFGDGVRHDVELLDAIEQEPSGKYRFCVSKVARP